MVRTPLSLCAASLLLVCASASTAFAQLSPTADWATHAQNEYAVAANITYLTATGYESKLDVYRRRDVQTPQPTLVFYHGGGWIGGTKEASFMSIMPWLEMGWNVVNVEYRMARVRRRRRRSKTRCARCASSSPTPRTTTSTPTRSSSAANRPAVTSRWWSA